MDSLACHLSAHFKTLAFATTLNMLLLLGILRPQLDGTGARIRSALSLMISAVHMEISIALDSATLVGILNLPVKYPAGFL